MIDLKKKCRELQAENESLRLRIAALEGVPHQLGPQPAAPGPGTGQEAAQGTAAVPERTDAVSQTGQSSQGDPSESPRRLKALMDNSPESILLIAPDGTILLANRTTCQRLGLPASKIVGHKPHEVLPPEVAEVRLRHFLEVVRTGKPLRFEDTRLGCSVENVMYPILDEHGTVLEVAVLGIDRTEHQQVVQALRRAHDELEQRVRERTADLSAANERLRREIEQRKQAEEGLALFRRLAESSSQGIGISDLKGRVVYMNPTLRRLANVGQDQADLAISQTVPQELREGLYAEAIPSLLRDGQWQGERVSLAEDGTNRFTLNHLSLIRDSAGQPAWIAGIVTDITDRKRDEEALRQSHDELRSIYEGTGDGVLIADCRTGRFLRANPAMCRMLGYREDTLLCMSVQDIHAPEVAALVLEKFQTQPIGEPMMSEDRPVLRSDGTVLYADIANVRIVYDGRPCVVGIFRDNTERKESLDALQRERQSLWHMLQASDHERQTIAYEIHDGLAQYLAAAGMQFQTCTALCETKPDEAHKAYDTAVELVRQAHNESRRLISEVRPPVIDEIGLETAISHLVYEQRRGGGPKIQLDTDVQFERLPSILENALYRIVQEALTNASKHSQSDRVCVTLAQEGQDVRIEVRDWGIGFDPDSVQKDHFGLEGIRQRVRLLGGRMEIASRPGSGTSLTVVIPLVLR